MITHYAPAPGNSLLRRAWKRFLSEKTGGSNAASSASEAGSAVQVRSYRLKGTLPLKRLDTARVMLNARPDLWGRNHGEATEGAHQMKRVAPRAGAIEAMARCVIALPEGRCIVINI